MNLNDIVEDILKQHENSFTELGEPQAWIYFDNERSMEVVEERSGLQEENYYYSCRLHCSEDEFNEGIYNSTCGIIETHSTNKLNKGELEWCIKRIINCNNRL